MELTSQTLEEGKRYFLKFDLRNGRQSVFRGSGELILPVLEAWESWLADSPYAPRGASAALLTPEMGHASRVFVVFAQVVSAMIEELDA